MSQMRDLADKANLEQDRKTVEAHYFVEEQKIKKALAPQMWEKLKALFREECKNMTNSCTIRLSVADRGYNEQIIRNLDNGRTAVLAYNSDAPCVSCDSPEGRGMLSFKVSPDGTCVSFFDNSKMGLTHESEIIFEVMHSLTR